MISAGGNVPVGKYFGRPTAARPCREARLAKQQSCKADANTGYYFAFWGGSRPAASRRLAETTFTSSV
jgi:hypothetical protein